MSVVDKPRIISAEVKKRNNYFERDVTRPHISGELWMLSDKCSERNVRYVEVRDGQLLVFSAPPRSNHGPSSRRLPEWRLPLYHLNLLPYPLGNPFCFSFSRRDHSIPVAVFQAQNQEDYEKWVRALAAELICQTPFDHVRFLDILGITATLQQHQQKQQQQQQQHPFINRDSPSNGGGGAPTMTATTDVKSKDQRSPLQPQTQSQSLSETSRTSCLLKEKQQNVINNMVQSSFVKNCCFKFKTNVHRKYESHRRNKIHRGDSSSDSSVSVSAPKVPHQPPVTSNESHLSSGEDSEKENVEDSIERDGSGGGLGHERSDFRTRLVNQKEQRGQDSIDGGGQGHERSDIKTRVIDSQEQWGQDSIDDGGQGHERSDIKTRVIDSKEQKGQDSIDSGSQGHERSDIKTRILDRREQKGQQSYLHSFYRKLRGAGGRLSDKHVDRVPAESTPDRVLPDVVRDLPDFDLRTRTTSDLKSMISCPDLKSAADSIVAPLSRTSRYARKTASSCNEWDSGSDDSCPSLKFHSVSNLLARCQESDNYVPVKDKLILFESLCNKDEVNGDLGLNGGKLRSRSLHDLGRAQDEDFDLSSPSSPRSQLLQSHGGSVRSVCDPNQVNYRKGGQSRNSNLVKNICRYFEHRSSSQLRIDQSFVSRRSSHESSYSSSSVSSSKSMSDLEFKKYHSVSPSISESDSQEFESEPSVERIDNLKGNQRLQRMK